MRSRAAAGGPAVWRVALAAVLYAASGLAGWWAGYAFGMRAGGTWVAIVAGLNSAVFCTLMADIAASRLAGVARDHRRA